MHATADWAALGTGVRLAVTMADRLAAARRAVEVELEAMDRACSRFRPDSELSRLNSPGGAWVEVSPLLLEAVSAALWAAKATDGAVDPTIGRSLRAAGYDRDFASVPASALEGVRLVAAAGWHSVQLDERRRRIRVPPGVELDLGATAKGLAADRTARAALAAVGEGGVLVSLGGDMAVAGAPPDGGWPVLVADRSDATDPSDGEMVWIETGGLASSNIQVRRWRRGGIELHHILDPATGRPAAGPWRTVCVAAASCLEANAAATAAIVLGRAAPGWLEAAGLPARLVTGGGEVTRIGAWPR